MAADPSPEPAAPKAAVAEEEDAGEEETQDTPAPVDPSAIKKMKVAELREQLAARELSTKGKKDVLIQRLIASAAPADVPAQSPRRLHSTPKRPAQEQKQDKQATVDSPIEIMSIGAQDAIEMDGRPSGMIEMDGRPSGMISPSHIGKAIAAHQPAATAAQDQSSSGRKRNLDALESELDGEVDSRCQLMLNNARALGDALRAKFTTQLARLSKKNKTMTLREFAESYGVGVEAQIMCDIRSRLAAEGWKEPQKNAIGALPQRKHARNAMPKLTPRVGSPRHGNRADTNDLSEVD